MSVIDNTPANKNFLSPLNFRFQIKKAPHVNFFIQKVNIPSIALPNPTVSNPFVNIPYPGEHLRYGDLEISFKVDEDLQNYLEIHNWLVSLGKPENFDQYKQIQNRLRCGSYISKFGRNGNKVEIFCKTGRFTKYCRKTWHSPITIRSTNRRKFQTP